jgi:hypothetical protein
MRWRPSAALAAVVLIALAQEIAPVFTLSAVAAAQPGVAPGRLAGRITDPAGAPLPGITLVISGPALAEPRRVVTDGDGRFDAPGLPAGSFSVTCIAPGFVEWRREGLEVTAGEPVTLNVVMRPLPAQTPGERPPGRGVVEPEPPPPPPPPPGPPLPGELIDRIDSFLDQLPEGSIAFNAPQTMLAGETVEMRLVLSPQLSVEALAQRLEGLPGGVQGATVRVAPVMEAVLTGQNFAVAAITPERQAVARNEPTEWRWQVTATTAGEHRLHLVLNVQVDGTSRTLRTFDRTIQVDVTLGRQISAFATDNWQWLWTTALVPLAGWAWKRRQTSRRPPQSTPVEH